MHPTSIGEIFSPPRLMSSLILPVRVRKPSSSRKPWSPVWNQPPARVNRGVKMLLRSRWIPARTICGQLPTASLAAVTAELLIASCDCAGVSVSGRVL